MIVQTSTAEFQHMHLNETKKAKESIICVMLEQDMASSQFDNVLGPSTHAQHSNCGEEM